MWYIWKLLIMLMNSKVCACVCVFVCLFIGMWSEVSAWYIWCFDEFIVRACVCL
jgi:hypothetical protein